MMRKITEENNKNFIEISKETLKKYAIGVGALSIAGLLGVVLKNTKSKQSNDIIEVDYEECAIDNE